VSAPLRTSTSKPIRAPIGPSGETVAASSGPGKIRLIQPQSTSTDRRIQPNPCTQPSTSLSPSSSPPIHTTSSALKTIDSSPAYRRTPWKYRINRAYEAQPKNV
jgi:ribosomal protein L28